MSSSKIFDTVVDFVSNGGGAESPVGRAVNTLTSDPMMLSIAVAIMVALCAAGVMLFARRKSKSAGPLNCVGLLQGSGTASNMPGVNDASNMPGANAASNMPGADLRWTNSKVGQTSGDNRFSNIYSKIIAAALCVIALSLTAIISLSVVANRPAFGDDIAVDVTQSVQAHVADDGSISFTTGVIKNGEEDFCIGVRKVDTVSDVDLSDSKLVVKCDDQELYNGTVGKSQLNDNYVSVDKKGNATLDYKIIMSAEQAFMLIGTKPVKISTTVDLICTKKGKVLANDGVTPAKDADVVYSYTDPYDGTKKSFELKSDDNGEYEIPKIKKGTNVTIAVSFTDGTTKYYNEINDSFDSDDTLQDAVLKMEATADNYTFKAPGGGQPIVYSGQGVEAEFSAGTGAGDVETIYYAVDGTENWTTTAPTNAGTYKVKIDVKEGSKYSAHKDLTDSSWKFTITQKDVSLDWPAENTFKYDGQQHTYRPTLNGVLGADELTLVYKTGEEGQATAAGNYQTTVESLSGAAAGNYKFAAGVVKTHEWTIEDDPLVKRAYACWNKDIGKLTFYYDDQRSTREAQGFKCYDLNEGTNEPAWITDGISKDVQNIELHSTFSSFSPTSTSHWCDGFNNSSFVSVIFDNLNVANLMYTSYMFNGCSRLQHILCDKDLSGEGVLESKGMFDGCLKLPNFDENVTDKTNAKPNDGESGYFCPFKPTYKLNGDENVKEFLDKDGKVITDGEVSGYFGSEILVKPVAKDGYVIDSIKDNTGATYTPDKDGYVHIPAKFNGQLTITTKKESGEGDCLCFEHDGSGEATSSTVKYVNAGGNAPDMQYSFDGEQWETWSADTDVTLNAENPKMYVKGNNPEGFSLSDKKYTIFSMTGTIKASGNVMSLIDDGACTTTEIPCDYCFKGLFTLCESLVSAPLVPAEKLTNYCYIGMFSRCINLETAPKLPSKSLAAKCYLSMFYGCSGLKNAPTLPAETLYESSYESMFSDCTSLETPPVIQAKTLGENCCENMFSNCEGLKTAPVLSAENLANCCYYGMFVGCTGLTVAPELPATTLANECYFGMFNKCTGLTSTPELKATNLMRKCYSHMFINCSNITIITPLPATTLAESCYEYMFQNCSKLKISSSSGTEFMKFTTDAEGATSGMFVGTAGETENPEAGKQYYYEPVSEIGDCLAFEHDGSGEATESTVKYVNAGGNAPDMQYSCDGEQWETWSAETDVTLNAENPKMYVKGNNPEGFSTSDADYTNFAMTGKIKASGNVMSLIDDGACTTTEIPSSLCFILLFNNCACLETPPSLPATTLKTGCYYGMFSSCSSLTIAPSLPANELAGACYCAMFEKCTSLASAPVLKANKLANNCYASMFSWCSGLTNAPELNATTLANSCYSTMFANCSGLKSPPELPATELAVSCYNMMFFECIDLTSAPKLDSDTMQELCYQGMFYGCKSLNSLPDLPANTLADKCYKNMFYGCTGVKSAPDLLAKTAPESCYERMFFGCTSLETPPLISAETLASGCFGSMFSGCTSLKAAPELSATTLADSCYSAMFDGCTSLANPPELPSENLASSCYRNMFFGCTELTSAPALPALNLTYNCYAYMFENCTALTSVPELSAQTLADSCYCCMFSGCSRLKFSATSGTPFMKFTTDADGATSGMFADTAGETDNPVAGKQYYYEPVSEIGDCLCFEHDGSGEATSSKVKYISGGGNTPNMQYSYDKSEWFDWVANTNIVLDTDTPKIYVKGNNPEGFSPSLFKATIFEMTGRIKASGNVMSLIDNGACTTTDIPCDYCFFGLFKDCKALVSAPELPAEKLTTQCYMGMFYGCINLQNSPSLPSKYLADSCYRGMFEDCTALESAPELPAETMFFECYADMFAGCSKLNAAPALTSTSLAEGCYSQMFYDCIGLTSTPELPADTLAESCYYDMFHGCSNLTSISVLPATTLAKNCYAGMYHNCKKLKFSTDQGSPFMKFTTGAEDATTGMFAGTAGQTANPEANTTYYYKEASSADECLNFEHDGSTGEMSSTIKYTNEGGNTPDMQYSYDKEQWETWNPDTDITLDAEHPKIYVKGDNAEGFSFSTSKRSCFQMTGRIKASGNVMSLIDNGACSTTEIPCEYCFEALFYSCDALISCPELPAVKLNKFCYQYMFCGCIGLSGAPSLPAQKMEEYCYYFMFMGSSITRAPELNAKELAKGCYNSMFYDCNSLSSVPELPAQELVQYCYSNMFNNCQNISVSKTSGTPFMKFTSIVEDSANSMFANTAGETDDPVAGQQYYCEPPVEIGDCLAFEYDDSTGIESSTVSYSNTGSSSPNVQVSYDKEHWITWYPYEPVTLNSSKSKIYVKGNNRNGFSSGQSDNSNFVISGKVKGSGNVMSLIDNGACTTTEIPNEACFAGLFVWCDGLTSSPELPATKLSKACYNSMFLGCGSLITPPELPAQELEETCYGAMFALCSGLKSAPELPADNLVKECYANMFYQCKSLRISSSNGVAFMKFSSGPSEATTGMFADTAGETDDPVAGKQYYYVPPMPLADGDAAAGASEGDAGAAGVDAAAGAAGGDAGTAGGEAAAVADGGEAAAVMPANSEAGSGTGSDANSGAGSDAASETGCETGREIDVVEPIDGQGTIGQKAIVQTFASAQAATQNLAEAVDAASNGGIVETATAIMSWIRTNLLLSRVLWFMG